MEIDFVIHNKCRNTLIMTKGNIVNSQPLVLGSSSASPGTLNHTSGVVTGEFRKYFANQRVLHSSQLEQARTCDVTVNFTSAPVQSF